MTDTWHETQLGDQVDIKHGFAFKGEFFSDAPTKNILLTPGNFAIGGGFQWGKPKFYEGPIPREYILSEGDLVVTMTDLSKAADTLGYSAIIPSSEKFLLHNQRVGKVMKKTNSIDEGFLHYLLRSRSYRNEVLASATGSTVKHTSPTKICAYRFFLPPISEQKDIASVLGALDNKIENNRRMNETLEKMARAIFKSWFVDFDPVHVKVEGRQPAHMNAETAALFPDKFNDDGLPEGWSWGTLENYTETNPEVWSARNAPDKIEYVDLANTKWGIIESTQEFVWEDAPSRARRIIRPGDTIVGTVRPGNGSYTYINAEGLTASTGFAVLRPTETDFREFVYLSATAPENIDRLAHLADGAAYPAVRPDEVSNTVVVDVDRRFLREFYKAVSPLIEKSEANKKENQTLAQLRDMLLPKLMSGEIRVGDAKDQVEAVA